MKALIAIAATAYALTLWMFAPRSTWERELAAAKRNQNRLTQTPELEASAQPETTPEPEPDTQPIEPDTILIEPDTTLIEPDTIPTPEPLNLETFTTTQLRELAKQQKLNWRPLVNGKRKPLNKPQLIQLLTA